MVGSEEVIIERGREALLWDGDRVIWSKNC
jgi:hypothetical protein